MERESPSLPPEIWLHITRFIPDITLRDMIGVNVFFYNISMELRYKSVELQKFKPSTMKLLSRLADPSIGRRVQYLTASPDFRSGFHSGSSLSIPPARSVRDRVNNILQFSRSSLSGATPALRPEEEATRALINALPSLSNIMAFTIDSHSWSQHTEPKLRLFLNTSWFSFGSNLKKLSLRGHAASFRTIITSNPTLPMVEELFFELTDNPSQPNIPEDADTLITVLAPFINSFSSKLQALTFWAWSSLELSAMFNCLGEFPLLTCFNFQASFSRNLSVDPSSLSNMLNKHRHQLEILVLRLDTTPHLAALSHQPLSEWLRSTFQENHFSRLQQLQLYPSALPQGFDGLLSCIQQSAETLQRLVVREHYLDAEGVTRLLNHIPPNLQFLRLNVHELTIEIFDDLAAKLPRLYSLSLYISRVPPLFTFDVESRSFKDWNLHNIGIWQSGSMVSIHLMGLIKESIPSVDSFWDLGTTTTEELTEPYNLEWSTRNVDDGVR